MAKKNKKSGSPRRVRLLPPKNEVLFCKRDGHRLAVLRPSDPAGAIAVAKSLVGVSTDEYVKAIDELMATNPHRYVGIAAYRRQSPGSPFLVDEGRRLLGQIQPGDSFVHLDSDSTDAYRRGEDPYQNSSNDQGERDPEA